MIPKRRKNGKRATGGGVTHPPVSEGTQVIGGAQLLSATLETAAFARAKAIRSIRVASAACAPLLWLIPRGASTMSVERLKTWSGKRQVAKGRTR